MSYYERHLPHWQPEGAALFVTWRLHGSLPAVAGETFTKSDRQLDHATIGPRWLTDQRVSNVVAESLHYGEHPLKLYRLRAWVVMINHVHILIYPEVPLRRITQALKSYSARKANAILNRTGQPFWQHESYDHWVRSATEVEKIVRYIERNPVKAGLVQTQDQWRWSSAWESK